VRHLKSVIQQKITITSLECVKNKEKPSLFKCIFRDELGSQKIFVNILFGNIEVENSSSILYHNNENNELVITMTFKNSAHCEIFGQYSAGLFLKCKNHPARNFLFG